MSEIALYNALTKLGTKHNEAKEAIADVAFIVSAVGLMTRFL